MASREGQVWEMGNGLIFLVLGPPESGRQIMLEIGHPWGHDKRRKALDRAMMHPVLYLETGARGSLMEEREGKWDGGKGGERHA